MYDYAAPAAFVLRLSIFFLIFTTYPLVAYFLYDLILKLFNKGNEPKRIVGLLINVGINLFPLICSLYIPHIATLLGIVGTIAGYLIIYVLPIFVFLKHQRTKLTNPLLAEAIVHNEFKAQISDDKSPQLEINNDFLRKQKNLEARQGNLPSFGNSTDYNEGEATKTIDQLSEAQ